MRFVMALWLVAVPAFILAGSVGCEQQKTTTVHKEEQIRESEPQMVSPGVEVVE